MQWRFRVRDLKRTLLLVVWGGLVIRTFNLVTREMRTKL